MFNNIKNKISIKYMNNPIKIIHKFKNNNKRIQYNINIFIGDYVNEDILNVLKNIKLKSFYDTLIFLSKNKMELLNNYYGNMWYKFFFNKYHINNEINTILKNSTKKKVIIEKFGKIWVQTHFESDTVRKVEYSFAANYYDYLIARNKIKTKSKKREIDFTTYQSGGNDTEENIDDKISDDEENIQTTEDLDDEVADDFDLEELTKLYSMDNVETTKESKNISKLISEATKDKSWIKESEKVENNFNDKLDNLQYDSKLEDIYEKNYIFDEYIFMDDNIITLKNKICSSLSLNKKYEDLKFLPEYQYFWTEYNLNDKVDRIMVGQKWIRRNELIKIDIKPNDNISVYENLRNNLGYLKEGFGIKIKREDDTAKIIRDYEKYMNFNEIYMIDLINEVGINYNKDAEKKRNLYEVYVNIYFPLITYERFDSILNFLNNKDTRELDKNMIKFNTIKNDNKLEKEIYNIIENTKLEKDKYDKYFDNTHILQTIIHVNLTNPKNITGTVSKEKFDLYKIFDNFIVTDVYPFIQYQSGNSELTYKFYTQTKKIDDQNILSKWFDNAPYGISFKIKVEDNKFISINLNENCKIEYKITWMEKDKATVDDIQESYKYINNLILKINNENKKIKIILPNEDDFKYAFINTIQKFIIPDKIRINHNDLSDFSRFFYTYISLVIEPKKRKGKDSDLVVTSKYGTYLRYKRVSNYENKMKMHLRILYFLRNYDISDKDLVDEISKQFNITLDNAGEELDEVKNKFSKVIDKIKSSSKKLITMPKSKPPGIGIDIQGRSVDKYKIRIAGARSKEQLYEIISFIKVLIYIYIETYLNKRPKFQKIKNILTKLNKIAKRRNKVKEVMDYENEMSKVKEITSLDKKRLGFRPEEGQNQWTRSCQNSGEDKKRRPLITNNIKELTKRGYKYNPKTDFYEKQFIAKGKKNKLVTRAVKLTDEESNYNYYTCDPDENIEHTFIGFLSKSNNPNDLCMPCCFKKDQMNSKAKKNYYLKCIGDKKNDDKIEQMATNELTDKVYILQDTNKIQEGRFIFLPKYLNEFFNKVWKNDKKIKNHYLIESNSGYYFKFTVKDNNYFFLAAIANCFDTTVDELKNLVIKVLNEDKDNKLFTYLNNGDICSIFTKDEFIKYIKNSNYLEYDILGELLAMPKVLSQKGIFYFILEKKVKIIKKELEKTKFMENYYIKCLNPENNYYLEEDREFIILIKEGKYYFPIYKLTKRKIDKKIDLQKKYDNKEDNSVLKELFLYYNKSCLTNIINNMYEDIHLNSKNLINRLKDTYKITTQIIDLRNKVQYIEINNKIYLPTIPSGSHLDFNIKSISSINNKKILSLSDTIKELSKIEKLLDLDYKPKLVYYDKIKKGSPPKYNITSILLKNKLIIPINNEYLSNVQFKKYGLSYEYQTLDKIVQDAIDNNKPNNDGRALRFKNILYKNEGYNLFRLEMSLYFSENNKDKELIDNILKNKDISKKDKKNEILEILIRIINIKLQNKIIIPTKKKSLFEISKNLPNLETYSISNIRDYCKIYKTKEKCNSNLHCIFIADSCKFNIYDKYGIEYINRLLEEIIQNDIKYKELIQEDTYYVSDIVDHTQYSQRQNQKIIKTTNFNIKKIMSELFGKDSMPKLGKKRLKKISNQEEETHELIILGKQYIQEIVPNNNSIIRAYINSYYWINNNLYDIESRNLGYISELQTHITNLFKANIIDYIQNNKLNKELSDDIKTYFENSKNFFDSAINKFRKTNTNTDGVLELTVLSYLFDYPIVVFDNFNRVKSIYSNGPVKVTEKTSEKYTDKNKRYNTIFLKFNYEGNNTKPKEIFSIYYLN